MNQYAVELSDAALTAITEQARHIAVKGHAPENAKRWLERVWDAVDSLELSPSRGAKAQEDAYVVYEVRQLVVGSHLLLFTLDDAKRTVWVLGLRHGHRLPHPGDLPPDLGALGDAKDSEE